MATTAVPLIDSSRAMSSPHAASLAVDKPETLEALYFDQDDESFEVPDFHFDWGVAKEEKPDKKESLARRRPAVTTPPSLATHSVQSSASSGHVLTDASTASGSSLVPTPPDAGVRLNSRSLSSQGSDGSSGRGPKTYGGRQFQRVVSAPLGRGHGDKLSNDFADLSVSTSHTATLRPALVHTSSAGSIPTDSSTITRSQYVTPGLAERTMASSTSRRLGGLSRFGGPARRVITPLEAEAEVDEGSPALIGSPRSPPPESPPEAGPSRQPRPRDPISLRRSPPPEERPFRPFQRPDQENQHKSTFRLLHQDSHDPQPLQPTHILPRPDHVVETKQLRSTRPAPLPDPPRSAPLPELSRIGQSTAVLPAAAQTVTAPLPAPTQIIQPAAKRSFLVNGAAYERLGVLGKGGSSKVYSVLCPTNRVVYALKRVALDRADSETYQSYTNEIELLRRLKGHDRIIQLIDFQITFSQNNRPKMLMMIMECGEIDFAMLLDEQRGKPLNMNFVGLYWQQMLEAVYAVHLENVVHTDLKPANFVLVKGRLKIIDFGIAKAIANDTVNIQRDQQIGTVNYMSPEAIQRMNNQKVLKLSYPSDVWSLGCILYQMIYGTLPFQHIPGGPLAKMNVIADPAHKIDYPDTAVPKAMTSADGTHIDPTRFAVLVSPAAIDTMRRCLAYRKDQRLTIPELLQHEFLRPKIKAPPVPPGSTSITSDQMAMLVNFILGEHGLRPLGPNDTTAEDLFTQLEAQNSLNT